jgi:regulator of protease activity HflC (stomatin/prohibitin superfamily)
MGGVDKLIDLIVQFLEFFKFCTVVDCYERGVRLRFGKFKEELNPGFHWQWPFFIDNILTENVVPKMHQLFTQSVATLDDKPVAMGVVVCYSIRSISKAVLEVENVAQAVNDACQATIVEVILASTWDEVRSPTFTDKMTAACRKRGWKYGIEIESVRFCELAIVRTYRTITGA